MTSRKFLSHCIMAAVMLVNSGDASVLFDCNFDSDKCGLMDDSSVKKAWTRHTGPTDSRNTGPESDHTTGAAGYYMLAEATGTENGDIARMYSAAITGTADNCTRIRFYYHMYGGNMGYLKLYLLEKQPFYFTTPVWEANNGDKNEWQKADIEISISIDYKIAFEVVFARAGISDTQGDIAIDDISIDTISPCSHSSCDDNDFFCLNGGSCAAESNSTGLEYKCLCTDGWSGNHCQNDFDECAASPCVNGKCTHGLNSFECSCNLGFYGDLCEYNDTCLGGEVARCLNGGTCNRDGNDFNCTCAPGYTGGICDVNIDDCQPDPCENGAQCIDRVNAYECNCAEEYYGTNCQSLAGSCDFEDASLSACAYKTEYYFMDWIVNQGRTPIPSFGPSGDHTTGNGSYVYAEVNSFEDDEIDRTARLSTPFLPKASAAACTTVTFWYYMEGGDVGTLNLFTRSESNTVEASPVWTMSGDQGTGWKKATVEISYPVKFALLFDAVSKRIIGAIQSCHIGLDDISVAPGTCFYRQCSSQPCQNGGVCFEENGSYRCECKGTWTGTRCDEDRNECLETNQPCLNGGQCVDANPGYICTCTPDYVGYSCEYLKGSCDFDDMKSQLCGYTTDPTGDFEWSLNQGPTDTDLTGPSVDHTSGTSEGYYLYVEASEREGGDRARIVTPQVPYKKTCTALDFWYHMYGSDVGELAVYIRFADEVVTTPIWNIIGGRNVSENAWKQVQLNISVPSAFYVVFEATVLPQSIIEPDNRGDIAIDDVLVHFDRSCTYDVCFLNPCKNGGLCIAVNGDYECDCKPGFAGKDCENVPACDPNPCQNGGTCVLGAQGKEECLCVQGYTGDNCELRDQCYPNPCEHGGVCTSFQTTFQCDCVPGYVGSTCATELDECSVSPCKNGGVCVDLVNDFRCDCKGSYIGSRCEKIEGGCDFQSGFCNWIPEEDHLSWTRNSGPSPNWPSSGPRYDHTYDDDSGYYAFTAVYKDRPEDGATYRLKSPTFSKNVIEPGKILTFEFYYHMYGPSIGTLIVYYTDYRGTSKIGTILKEDDRTDWQQFTRKIEPASDFSFTIEHDIGRGGLYLADMAIDDISFLIDDGSIVIESTTTVPTTIITTTAKSTTVKPTTKSTTILVSTPNTMKPTSQTTGKGTMPASTTAKATGPPTEPICIDCLDDEDEGLSGGAIAGIVIGVLAGVVLAGGFIFYYRRRRYEGLGPSPQGLSNVGYNSEFETVSQVSA